MVMSFSFMNLPELIDVIPCNQKVSDFISFTSMPTTVPEETSNRRVIRRIFTRLLFRRGIEYRGMFLKMFEVEGSRR